MKNYPDDYYQFQNLQEDQMSFDQVFKHIVQFMQSHPNGNYRLMVGTDSQVHQKNTVFITGIVIQNKGNGVWACIRKVVIPRKMIHLKEKISYEMSLSEEIVSLFTEERKKQLTNIVLPYLYHGATFTMEAILTLGPKKRIKHVNLLKK